MTRSLRPVTWLCAAALLTAAGALWAADGQGYKPLFSEAVLSKADPETRARLEALNERNRQRWLEQQPGRPPRAGRSASAPSAAGAARPGDSPAGTSPAGTLYRYKDAQGNVRFSDQHVPGAEAVSVDVSKPTAASRAEHEARQREQARMLEYFDDRNRRSDEEARAAAAAQAKNEQHQNNCRDLFNEIRDNRRGGFRSYEVGKDGERVYLSPEELARRTDKMAEGYEKRCGKLPPID